MGGAPKLVTLARIRKPHGVRGEVRVLCLAESPHALDIPRLFLLDPEGSTAPCRIESARPHRDGLLLKLEGIDSREAAETLRGSRLAARASDLPEPEPGQAYLHELEGLPVRLADGSPLGRITGFLAAPTEIWRIETPDGREILFPAAPRFVLALGPDSVTIDPPEGLLDLYLAAKD